MNTTKSDRKLSQILGKFGMTTIPVSLVEQEPNQPTEQLSLRVIMPSTQKWPSLVMENGWEKRGNLETHGLAARLSCLRELSCLWRRRNERPFRMEQFTKTQVFHELRKTIQYTGKPEEFLTKLMGESSGTIERLLENARYSKELTAVPIDRVGYEEFVYTVLEEFEDLMELIRAESAKQAKLKGESLDRHVVQTVRHIVKRAWRVDSDEGKSLQPLAERADCLLSEAAQRLEQDEHYPVAQSFDWESVDQLIRDAVLALREREANGLDLLRDEIENLTAVLDGGSQETKVEGLFHIWRNFRDRSLVFEKLLREVDEAGSYLLGQACRQLYRSIRGLLSPVERRIFILMYLQQLPKFGGPSPSFPLAGRVFHLDPVLRGFLEDDRGLELITLVIGFKRTTLAGVNLVVELEKRFKAYLAFYPYWLAVTRETEREARKRRRTQARLRPIDKVVELEKVASPSTDQEAMRTGRDWLSQLRYAVTGDNPAILLEEYSIHDPRGIARMRWVDGVLEREIANDLGISQQAVSKVLRRITKRLLEKLQADGRLPEHAQLPKGKWSPRA